MIRLLALPLFLFVLTTSAACGIFSSGTTFKEEEYEALSSEEQEATLASLRAAADEISKLRGLAKVTLKKNLASDTFTQSIVLRRPGDFRLEIFASNLQQLAMLAVASEGEFRALDFSERVAYQGIASRETFASLFFVPLSVDEFAAWLLGRASFPPDVSKVKLFREKGGATLVMRQFLKTGVERRCFIDANSLRLQKFFIIDAKKKALFESSYSEESVEDLPSEIRFTSDTSSVTGRIRYAEDSLQVNSDLGPRADRLFNVRIPSSFELRIVK